jgi:ABC-2 type transport system permease protein
MQLTLISQNTSRGLRDVPVAVLDYDQSALSREFVQEIAVTKEMIVRYHPRSQHELQQLLDDNLAQVGIVIPHGFQRQFQNSVGDPAQIQALVDGTNIMIGANTEPVLNGVLGQLFQRHALMPPGLEMGGVQVYTRALFNPTFDIQWFIIPSTVVFIIYQGALVLAATGFVREKEGGTLEQLLITPIRRLELIIGKALPPIVLSMGNFLILMAVETFIFHIPIHGSFPLLTLLTLLSVIAIVGVGTVISIVTQNQQQAVLLVFLLSILEVTISGYMLPVENMPLLMRWFAQISALQHFMTANLAIISRGATLKMISPNLLAISGIILATFVAAWRAFSRHIA